MSFKASFSFLIIPLIQYISQYMCFLHPLCLSLSQPLSKMVFEGMIIVAVVGWVVSPLITKLYDKVLPLVNLESTAKRLLQLKTEILPKAQAVIEVAETMPTMSQALESWLAELRSAARNVEAALEAHELYQEHKKAKKNIQTEGNKVHPSHEGEPLSDDSDTPPFYDSHAKPDKKDLERRVDKLVNVASHVNDIISILKLCNYNNNRDTSMTMKTQSSISYPPPAVYGRDGECDALMDSLISEHDESIQRVPVFAIHGIGGAGKTTLAQYFFHHKRAVESFGDNRMWVHVSRKFDAMMVTRKIVESITKAECPKMESLDAIQGKLREILKSSSKFLLVLDDVWCEDWRGVEQLEQLLFSLNSFGGSQGRILLTTRTKGAALALGAKKIICLKELEAEDCMSIVKFYASRGDDNVKLPEVEELINSKTVIEKLKKSPLAAKMLGIRLGSSESVFSRKEILRGDLLKDSINFLLQTSKHLPRHLQQCLAFTSLIPKGWRFKRDDLISLWEKKGLIERRQGKETSQVIASQYFDDLLSYSFIQPFDKDDGDGDGDGEKSYTMHALLYKLAKLLIKDEIFRIKDDSSRTKDVNKKIPDKVLYVSIEATELEEQHKSKVLEFVNLHTIVFISEKRHKDFLQYFRDMDRKEKRLRRVQKLHFKAMRFNVV